MNPNLKTFLIVLLAILAAWFLFFRPGAKMSVRNYRPGREIDPEDKVYELMREIRSNPKNKDWKEQIRKEAEAQNISFREHLRAVAIEELAKRGH